MKLPKIFSWILTRLNSCYNTCEAQKLLEKLSFEVIGSGMESYVYSRKGFEYVIKIQYDSHYNNPLSQVQVTKNNPLFAESFAVLLNGFPVDIKKKLQPLTGKDINKKVRSFIRKFKKQFPCDNDISIDNVGMSNGSIKAYDWAFTSVNFGERIDSYWS